MGGNMVLFGVILEFMDKFGDTPQKFKGATLGVRFPMIGMLFVRGY